MVSFWMYKYTLVDRSIGVVDYEVVEKMDDELPQLSLCFMNPFLREKLQDVDPDINSAIYLKYLLGEYYDDKLATIDYDNVTLFMRSLHLTFAFYSCIITIGNLKAF